MDIAKLKDNTLKVWVPFLHGAKIQVRHIPRDEFKEMVGKATTRTMVNGEIQEDFDNATFNDELCRAAVTDLAGFAEGEQPVPFSPDLLALLISKSSQFVTTVRGVCTDLDRLYILEAEQNKKK